MKALPVIEKILNAFPDIKNHASLVRLLPVMQRKEKKLDRKFNKLRRKAQKRPEMLQLAKAFAPQVITAMPAIITQVATIVANAEKVCFALVVILLMRIHVLVWLC